MITVILNQLGVPSDAIVIEGDSRNTYENAAHVAPILRQRGWTSALLITSGVHMPRALATFAKAGLEASAAATDIQGRRPFYLGVLDLLPDAGALAMSTSAIKEYIGLAVYRARGWI